MDKLKKFDQYVSEGYRSVEEEEIEMDSIEIVEDFKEEIFKITGNLKNIEELLGSINYDDIKINIRSITILLKNLNNEINSIKNTDIQ